MSGSVLPLISLRAIYYHISGQVAFHHFYVSTYITAAQCTPILNYIKISEANPIYSCALRTYSLHHRFFINDVLSAGRRGSVCKLWQKGFQEFEKHLVNSGINNIWNAVFSQKRHSRAIMHLQNVSVIEVKEPFFEAKAALPAVRVDIFAVTDGWWVSVCRLQLQSLIACNAVRWERSVVFKQSAVRYFRQPAWSNHNVWQ